MGVLFGEVAAVEGVDDEGLVAEVDDARDAVAGLQGRHRAGDELAAVEVLDGAVVVAVLHVLQTSEGEEALREATPSSLPSKLNPKVPLSAAF